MNHFLFIIIVQVVALSSGQETTWDVCANNNCPPWQKCVPDPSVECIPDSSCYPYRCEDTGPRSPNDECRNHNCKSWQTCYVPDPPIQCIPDAPCVQYQCWPESPCQPDSCGNCQDCIPEPKECSAEPCPQYRCQSACKPFPCGRCSWGVCREEHNCPPWETCVPDLSITCVRSPCQQYRCEAGPQNANDDPCSNHNCQPWQTCIPDPSINCITTPCPQYRCSPEENPCQPNPCKSCEECIPEEKQCIRHPCPQYRCQSECKECERCSRGRCFSTRRSCRNNPCNWRGRPRKCPNYPAAVCQRRTDECTNCLRKFVFNNIDVTRRCYGPKPKD